MTITDRLNDLLDRLDTAEPPETYELIDILRVLITGIELAHAQFGQRIHHLEERVSDLEK